MSTATLSNQVEREFIESPEREYFTPVTTINGEFQVQLTPEDFTPEGLTELLEAQMELLNISPKMTWAPSGARIEDIADGHEIVSREALTLKINDHRVLVDVAVIDRLDWLSIVVISSTPAYLELDELTVEQVKSLMQHL